MSETIFQQLIAATAPVDAEAKWKPTPGSAVVPGRPMPPLCHSDLKNKIGFYRMYFMEDGYPARRMEDGTLWEHPMYPVYVLMEYLGQWESTPWAQRNREFLSCIRTVADAALTRFGEFKDALVRWYEADAKVGRSFRRHYSGLTQAYYAKVFKRISRVLDDGKYTDAYNRILTSLTIPVSEGGIYRDFGDLGAGLEELPVDAPDLVLNGWLSMIKALIDIKKVEIWANQAVMDDLCVRLIEKNVRLLEHILPLYDREDVLNSRYSLAGFLYIRFVAKSGLLGRKPILRVYEPAVTCDCASPLSVPLGGEGSSRWTNFLVGKDFDTVDGGYLATTSTPRVNVLLSLLGNSEFRCVVKSDIDCKVELQAHAGKYDPLSSSPVDGAWRTLKNIQVNASGTEVSIGVSEALTDQVGYPTNFKKVIGGKRQNVYHIIHILRLHTLAETFNSDILRRFRDKWIGYTRQWKDSPVYRNVCEVDYASLIEQEVRQPFRLDSGQANS